MAFLLWSLVSLLFVGMAIACFCSKSDKPCGFWANAETFSVNDVKGYNCALGKLWLAFGVALEIVGLPLLAGQNSPLVLLSVIGTVFLSVALMVVYTTVIEPKYRKK